MQVLYSIVDASAASLSAFVFESSRIKFSTWEDVKCRSIWWSSITREKSACFSTYCKAAVSEMATNGFVVGLPKVQGYEWNVVVVAKDARL